MSLQCNDLFPQLRITETDLRKEKMNWKTYLTLALCSVWILSGCATTQPVDPRVKIIDEFVSQSITITEISSRKNQGGLLEVQVTGFNRSSSYKKLEYRIEWLDSNGFKIKTILSRWTHIPAFEKSEFRFKAVAPKPSASDFRILIRKGK
jgi:uncharacterized protein YcfL